MGCASSLIGRVGMADWLEQALSRTVVVRAAKTSLLVGTLLVVINQGDVLLDGGPMALSWAKVVLTYFVPYGVSTSSSVASRREQPRPSADEHR